MFKFFKKLTNERVVLRDPYPNELKACISDVPFHPDWIMTTGAIAEEALRTGKPLIGCKVHNGAMLQLTEVLILEGNTLEYYSFDCYRNLCFEREEKTNGDISKHASSFFLSHPLVIMDAEGFINLGMAHDPKSGS